MSKKQRAMPPLLESCEVCGNAKMEASGGTINEIRSCEQCGTAFFFYFRADGEFLSVPTAWGRCVAVVYQPESLDNLATDDSEDPEKVTRLFSGDYYYTFQGDDGTIRRARIGYAPFDERRKRPVRLPERITHYHFWVVDVCPAARVE